jgi:hypothetical protein
VKSFVAVGKALLTIRDNRLYREGFKTFTAYCTAQWGMGKSHANGLIRSSQVAVNLATAVALCTPCEIQPIHEQQVRPLRVLEPAQQRDVWEVAVRTAPVGKVCHFRTPAISVSGGGQTIPQKQRRCRPGLGSGRRRGWGRGGWGMVPADPWPRGKVTHDLLLG